MTADHTNDDDDEPSGDVPQQQQQQKQQQQRQDDEENGSPAGVATGADDDDATQEKKAADNNASNDDDDDDDEQNDDVDENDNIGDTAVDATAADTADTNGENNAGDNDNDEKGEKKNKGDSTAVAVEVAVTEVAATTPVARRPLKRARTAYFIFADAMRPSIQKEHPGEGVASQAKRIGAKWQLISPEEKEKFQTIAANERKRVAAEMEAYREQFGDDAVEDNGSANNNKDDYLIFPVARIRRIAKLDPEVKTLSKEALQLVVKSAELALAKLGQEAVRVARIQNRRTLLADDVAHVCAHRDLFQFLKEDIKDLTKEMMKQKKAKNSNSNSNNGGDGDGETATTTTTTTTNKKEAARVAAAAGSKPLTSYFGAAKKK